MASKRPQTMAKRARELAVKERRERKQARRAEAAARRTAGAAAAAEIAVQTDPQTERHDAIDARAPARGAHAQSP